MCQHGYIAKTKQTKTKQTKNKQNNDVGQNTEVGEIYICDIMPFIQFQKHKYIIYLYENRYGYHKHKSKEKNSIWEEKTEAGREV